MTADDECLYSLAHVFPIWVYLKIGFPKTLGFIAIVIHLPSSNGRNLGFRTVGHLEIWEIYIIELASWVSIPLDPNDIPIEFP